MIPVIGPHCQLHWLGQIMRECLRLSVTAGTLGPKATCCSVAAVSLFILPESPRWLVVNGHLDMALAVIHRVFTSSVLPTGALPPLLVMPASKDTFEEVQGTGYSLAFSKRSSCFG